MRTIKAKVNIVPVTEFSIGALAEHDNQVREKTIDEMVNNLIRNSRTEVIDDEITLLVTERSIELVAKEMKKQLKEKINV